jgi:hypothetical protein
MIKNIDKTNNEDVQLHILKFLQEHLPNNYVADVQLRTNNRFSNATIHAVKSGKRTNETILLALVELANENKNNKEKIAEIINN